MGLGRRFRRTAKLYVIGLSSALLLVFANQQTDAHKPVSSKYDYNRDIYPLFRDHCASCHVVAGPAPMSLMTYNDAVPWAESIREELTAGRMPPWPIDPTSPPVKGGYPISARDVDMIVVWASGGTPQGDTATRLPVTSFKPQWQLGPPDLKIPADEHMVLSSNIEEVYEFSLSTNLSDTKWVKAADLMPGDASIVRDAVISIENGPVLALWQPGSDVTSAPSGAAFRLVPGAKIDLQIHYKKHFDKERETVLDKSTLGLYFTEPPPSGRGLDSFKIDPPEGAVDPRGSSVFGGTIPGAARIVALRPMVDRAYDSLNIDAITPSGTRVPLLRLRGPRPQWYRRYWLQGPVELASGSKIEVRVMPLSDYSDEPKATKRFTLQVAFDYIPL